MKEHLEQLRTLFTENKNQERALAMSKYMKGLFPFIGIPAPKRREFFRTWFATLPKNLNREQIWELIFLMWNEGEREFHYSTIDFLNKINKTHIHPNDFPFIEKLVTTNSWWDSVDSIAPHYLAKLAQQYPHETSQAIEKWRNSSNIWLNRSCLLYQLKFRKNTDFELLKSLIIQYQPSKEFFIRKAIGWTLREYSKYEPERVRGFLTEVQLSGLSQREASKYL